MTDYTTISKFYSSLIKNIQSAITKSGYRARAAFNSPRVDYPIEKPTVILSINNISLPIGKGTLRGTDKANTKYYGVIATGNIGINIYIPKTSNGSKCYETFDAVVNAILNYTSIEVTELHCGELSYNRSAGAVVMSGGVMFNASFT